MRFVILASLPLLLSGLVAQDGRTAGGPPDLPTFVSDTVTLTPSIPATVADPTKPYAQRLENLLVTTGDLNNDGVPDFVFSNQLGFLRVYFMQRTGTGCSAQLQTLTYAEPPEFNWTASCSEAPRKRTLRQWNLDIPIVYDIDLDGTNELIYVTYNNAATTHNEKIIPVIYKWNPSGTTPQTRLTKMTLNYPVANDRYIGDLVTADYHASSCSEVAPANTPNKGGVFLQVQVANFRGRAYPQDILIGTNQGWLGDVCVFSFDNTASGPQMRRLLFLKEGTFNPLVPNINKGEAGHVWHGYDVDYDGRDELIGKNLYRFNPGTSSFSFMSPATPPVAATGCTVFRTDEANPGSSGYPVNIHPDQIAAGDLWTTYQDPAGNVIPSPGIELAVAAQVSNTVANAPGESGPWVYRAVSGHHLGDDSGQGFGRRWPRKLLNFDNLSPQAYWYLTLSSGSYLQPTALSNWSPLGTFLTETRGFPPSPNAQLCLIGDLVAASAGPELLTISKCIPSSAVINCPFSSTPTLGHVYYMFSSTNDLKALVWGESYSADNGPTIWGTRLADVVDDQSEFEVISTTGVECRNQANCLFQWTSSGGTVSTQKLWSAVDNIFPGRIGTTLSFGATDLLCDAREELFYYQLESPNVDGVYQTTKIVVTRQQDGVARTTPPPGRFLNYRKRYQGEAWPPNYREFTGLRAYTTALPRGVAGMPYGVAQDAVRVGGTGAGIVAEGGVPPYTVTLDSTGEPLQAGLTTSAMTLLPNSSANSTGAGGLLITGTPTERGIRRLHVKIQDSNTPPSVVYQDLWLRVMAGEGASQDNKPVITSGGYSGAYLQSGLPTSQVVTIQAHVNDADGDTLGVGVLVEGNLVTVLTPQGGGNFSGPLTFGPNLPPATSLLITLVAYDNQSHLSLSWPYLVVDGGPGGQTPAFEMSIPMGQTSATTATIDKVDFVPNTVPAAEWADTPSSVLIKVYVGSIPSGEVLDGIEARVIHPLTSGSHFPPINFVYQAALGYWEGAFNVPPGQFGWGNYTLNVRLRTAPIGTLNYHYSDWWPRLVIH